MSTKHMKVHVNCSPWREDGAWNIVLEHDYITFSILDDEHGLNFSGADELLLAALDKGAIHSYYIQRAVDGEPVKHEPEHDIN